MTRHKLKDLRKEREGGRVGSGSKLQGAAAGAAAAAAAAAGPIPGAQGCASAAQSRHAGDHAWGKAPKK